VERREKKERDEKLAEERRQKELDEEKREKEQVKINKKKIIYIDFILGRRRTSKKRRT
jgi:hypothetical protein